MEEAKITSVEKVKDPKRVEAGRRLAAMSKQAKDKKAVERLSQKMPDIPTIDSVNPLALVGVVGVVGAVVYYKYFYKESESQEPGETIDIPESKTLDPPKQNPKQKPKRRELDTLD